VADLALAALLLCVAAGTGMVVLHFFKVSSGTGEYLGLGVALGLGLLAYIFLVLGLLGWLYSGVIWGTIAFLIPPAIWGIVSFIKLENHKFRIVGRWEWLGIIVLIWCAFFNSFAALAPPFFADTLKYHLAVPKWYISLHQIQFAPVFPFNMPQNLEMINMAGMLMRSDTIGLFLHYCLGLFATLGIWVLAREFLPPIAAVWAAVFFYVGIPYIPHAAQGNDLGPIFYTVWAFFAFVKWRKTENVAWLCLAGALAGLCAGIKYTGIYTPFAFFFLVGISLLRDGRKMGWKNTHAARAMILFLSFGCLFGCPWYVKNWIMTGDPFYPVLYPLLGGIGWNLTSYQEGIRQTQEGMSMLGRSFFDFLLSPFRLLLLPQWIFARGGIGLITFSFMPVFFLFGNRYLKRYEWLLIFSLPFFTAWAILTQHGRFLLPLLAIWSIPCADVAFRLIKESGYLRIISVCALFLGVGMGVALSPTYAFRFLPVVVGAESKDSFLTKTTLFYQEIQWMNENLPADACVGSEFENLYHLDRNSIWIRSRDAAWIDYARVKTTEDIFVQFHELGITHIFAIGEVSIKKWNALDAQGLLERLYFNPEGRQVVSITMRITRTTPVAVYEVIK
jgi:hypothetical protein